MITFEPYKRMKNVSLFQQILILTYQHQRKIYQNSQADKRCQGPILKLVESFFGIYDVHLLIFKFILNEQLLN